MTCGRPRVEAALKYRLTSIMKVPFLLLALLLGAVGYAQDIRGGMKAGIVSAGIQGETSENLTSLLEFTRGSLRTRNHTGFYAGAYAQIPLGDSWSIEPGLYFSQKGYELAGQLPIKDLPLVSPSAKAVLKNRYADLPVIFQYHAGSLRVFAGPQVSYLLQSNLHAHAGILGLNLLQTTLDTRKHMNLWDASLTGGAALQITPGLLLTASYEHGLLKADANQRTNAYHHAFKAGLSVEF